MTLRIVELCTDVLPCPPKRGGAIETYVYGISKALKKLGAEVHLVTIKKRRNIDYNGVFTHEMNITSPVNTRLKKLLFVVRTENRNIPYLITELLRIFNEIEENYGEIDVIHSHYFTTSFAPIIFKYFIKKGGTLIAANLHNEPKPNMINKVLAKAYDVNLAVSEYVKQRSIKLLNIDPSKVRVVYNAVDTRLFKPCKHREKNEKRIRFRVADRDFVITFIGRIIPEKGVHHLLLASRILKRKGYRFKVLIAGPMGDFNVEEPKGYPKLCFKLLNKLDLSHNVRYLGRLDVSNTRELYCASDLIVVPSLLEDACPTVVLEAMATGRPVVAYASGGIPELIPPYGGVVVNKKDPRLLAKAIEMFLQGSVTFDELRVVEWIKERFSYEAAARKLLEIFMKMRNRV